MQNKIKTLESIRNIFKNPLLFVFLYILIIPIFAIFYYCFTELSQFEFTDSLYFSVVTITTLGYGDITPKIDITKFLASSEAILGIVLVGLFLNSLSYTISFRATQKEKDSQKKKSLLLAKERFLNYNKLIEQKIDRYYKYSVIVTKGTNNSKELKVNENFKFNDLSDIYTSSLALTDSISTSTIDFYYESQKELLQNLENLVALGFLQNWQELEKLCLDFIIDLKDNDFSDFILNQKNSKIGDTKYTEYISKMIKEYEGEVKPLGSNLLTPYVVLYYQIKQSIEFIEQYKYNIGQIK